MIKRRFYKLERGDKKGHPSDSSSSSDGEESERGGDAEEQGEADQACSTSSGYETEDSSANELDIDSSGLPINDEDDELQPPGDNQSLDKRESRFLVKQLKQAEEIEPLSTDFPDCVLKCKAVFKCRLCPRIVCLNEESLRAHLMSKRHSRSEKLLNEGRLKATLNSDGEIDNEDTSTKEDVEIESVSQGKRKREKGGRQRQHRRRQNKESKRKKVKRDVVKTRPSKERQTKKRSKREK